MLYATMLLSVCLWGMTHRPSASTERNERSATLTRPVLIVPVRLKDLGTTTVQKEWEVPFLVQNRGSHRLVINQVQEECGCLDRDRGTLVVPAHGSAEVTLRIDSRFAFGPVEVIAGFTCNDPLATHFNLIVRMNVNVPESPPTSCRTGTPEVAEGTLFITRHAP